MRTILAVNSGSSSLKLGLYSNEAGAPRRLLYSGVADAIGKSGGFLSISDATGSEVQREDAAHETQSEALQHASAALRKRTKADVQGIGFRIVHGGPRLRQHCRITPQVVETLRAATHYAPLHIPPALSLLEAAGKLYPDVPRFACFDTAFHTTMPAEACTYALPPRLRAEGVERYGFHGLSYESIVAALQPSVPERLVVAHLGNGASICAIASGASVDTSMGLTPTGGIPMGTRTGDLDPGVVLYIARQGGAGKEQMSAEQLEALLNHESGLLALSSTGEETGSADMRTLTKTADAGDASAQLAIAIFCRSIAKTIAGYAAVLGGLDSIVFTGGIGEHSAAVREAVCTRLAFLGVQLNHAANQQHARSIADRSSRIQILIMTADENGQIATHVQQMLESGA